MIDTGFGIYFSYEDAKAALKYFLPKIHKPKPNPKDWFGKQMSAFVNSDYVLLQVLQRKRPVGVDDKGRFYWHCKHADFKDSDKRYDVAGWQLAIILYLRSEYDKLNSKEDIN